MLFHFAAVLIFLLMSVAFVFGNLLIGWLVRPTRPNREKLLIYECGEPTIGGSWIRYNIRFYSIALVYLIFDVEVVFLFPVVLLLSDNELGVLALVEILTFVLILAIGLIYAWRYGSLDWISGNNVGEDADEESQVEEIGLGI